MKKLLFLLPVVVMFMAASCSKSDVSSLSVTEAEGLVPGTWRVTFYIDNSGGESNNFDGYEFTFSGDGTVTAVNGATTYSGLWTVSTSDDDPQYDKEIQFTISGNSVMDDLDGKWLITELSDSIMKLKDDTPSEEIHFEKI